MNAKELADLVQAGRQLLARLYEDLNEGRELDIHKQAHSDNRIELIKAITAGEVTLADIQVPVTA